MQNRDLVQNEIVQKIHEHDGHGIIAGATGIGKNKIVINYLMDLNSQLKVLWVVPTTKLRDHEIPEEWKKWGDFSWFQQNVRMICYKSLHKEDSYYDLVVLDEGHNLTLRAYKCITMRYRKYKSVIFLSATLPGERIKQKMIRHMRLPVIVELDVDEAVDKKLVAPFDVTLVPVPMSKMNDFRVKTKAKSYTTSEHNRYHALQNVINGYRAGKAPKHLYIARMHSIYRFKSKVEEAKILLTRLLSEGKRVLVFCGSIDSAEYITSHTYHSKTDDQHYTDFNAKRINHLAVVKSLNEGHNMTDVDAAIIIQVDSKKRNYIQRQGRVIRWREGHHANIYVLYSQNTVDYKWVRSSLSGISPDKIKIMHGIT